MTHGRIPSAAFEDPDIGARPPDCVEIGKRHVKGVLLIVDGFGDSRGDGPFERFDPVVVRVEDRGQVARHVVEHDQRRIDDGNDVR